MRISELFRSGSLMCLDVWRALTIARNLKACCDITSGRTLGDGVSKSMVSPGVCLSLVWRELRRGDFHALVLHAHRPSPKVPTEQASSSGSSRTHSSPPPSASASPSSPRSCSASAPPPVSCRSKSSRWAVSRYQRVRVLQVATSSAVVALPSCGGLRRREPAGRGGRGGRGRCRCRGRARRGCRRGSTRDARSSRDTCPGRAACRRAR